MIYTQSIYTNSINYSRRAKYPLSILTYTNLEMKLFKFKKIKLNNNELH